MGILGSHCEPLIPEVSKMSEGGTPNVATALVAKRDGFNRKSEGLIDFPIRKICCASVGHVSKI